MLTFRRIAATFLVLAVVASSFGASILGVWHGRLDMSSGKPPKGMAPDQAKKMRSFMESMRIELTFKADKTYFVSSVMSGEKKPQTRKGTWSQSGNAITVHDGKSTETMMVSANGKSLTMTPHDGSGMRFNFVR